MVVNEERVSTLDGCLEVSPHRKVTFGEYLTSSGDYRIEEGRAYSVTPAIGDKPEVKVLAAYRDEGTWKPADSTVFARYSMETSRSQRG